MEKGEFSKADKKKILDKYVEASVEEGIMDMTIHKEGIELIKRRIDDFDLGEGILSLEEKFGMDGGRDVTTEDGIPLIGAMDKVVKVDDDTILVVDYKTSKTAPTTDQMRNDIQLSIYDLVASIIWPEYKNIILSLDLLKSDIQYTYRTEIERADFSKYLRTIYDSMCNIKKKDAKAQLNIFCPWCDYKEYCPMYKKACEKSDYAFLSPMHYSDDKLIDEWKFVKSTSKILEERGRELSMIILEKIKRNGVNMSNTNTEIYIRQNARKSWDIDKIAERIPHEYFIKMVKGVNNKMIDDYVTKDPSAKNELKDALQVNYTKPFLAEKKAKTKEKK
jgi:hypothetical protein